MQKRFIAFLMAVILLSIPTLAVAAPAKEVSVYINGTKVKYAQAPITENGTTLVSARETIEGLGLTFSYDKGNKRIIGTNGVMTVAIVIGDLLATSNGVSVVLGTPAVEKNGRIMVPLRFLLDSVGASMTSKNNQIQITKTDQSKSKYYTDLPLQITNTTVTNLSKNAITVNYVEYLWDDEIYTMDYSLDLEAGKKGAFEHSSIRPGYDVTIDGVEYALLGRAVKSITVNGEEIASKSFKKVNNSYLNGTFQAEWVKAYDQYFAKYLKEELVKNKNVPLKITGSKVTHNNYWYPEVEIYVTNLTTKTIVGAELSFSCYDEYGNKEYRYGTTNNRFIGVIEGGSMKSGTDWTFTWQMSLYEETASVKNIQVDKVIYSDGTVWKRK